VAGMGEMRLKVMILSTAGRSRARELLVSDFAKADETAFEDLVAALRSTEEWKFVDRENDMRLLRIDN
jgi:hypothetical protein